MSDKTLTQTCEHGETEAHFVNPRNDQWSWCKCPTWNNTPSIGTEDLWSRTERQAETAENRRGWAEALRNGDD